MRPLKGTMGLAALIAGTLAAAPVYAQEAPEEPGDDTEEADGQPAGPVVPTVNPPALIEESRPVFPEKALADRVHGIVVVELSISDTGEVTGAAVGSLTVIPEKGEPRAGDGRYGFGEAAVEAAKKLRFRPAEYNGQPFAVQINFTYRFALPEAPEEVVETPTKEPEVNYKGKLLERGTRSTVAGAVVTVFRGKGDDAEGFEATSGADGSFVFYDLPEGNWTVRIEREGYIPVETDETLSTTEVVEGRYWIEKGSYSEYDITVEAERPKKEVNRRSLSAEAISKVPGAISDDPVLVVENLPGVARSGPTGGQIIVRGSGPDDTGVYVNGIDVPLIYHFGGLKSVLPSKVIGGVDFYPGNYSVAYGRAMGGIFDLQLKRLEPDIVHGSADVSILDTSLYLETPLGDDAAIAFAGRRSYVDFVLDAAIPEDAGLALTTAPRYYDYQTLGSWRPERAHEVRWLGMGSSDLLELLFDDPADAAGPNLAQSNDFSAETAFQRFIVDYKYTPSEKLSNHMRVALGRDQLTFDALGVFLFDLEIQSLNLRDTFGYKINDNVKLDVGLDSVFQRTFVDIRLPGRPPAEGSPQDMDGPDGSDIMQTTSEGEIFIDAAPFVEAQLSFGDLLVVPGLRFDYFGRTESTSFDPRITSRYELPRGFAVKGGAAVVHQAPTFAEVDDVFGNPDLELQRAYQYSVGGEWQMTEDLRGDLTFFYKAMRNLTRPSEDTIQRDGENVAEQYDNDGVGRVYGAEVFLEHQFNGSFSGWLSYTLMRAERRDAPGEDYRLFDFDQTHILTLVASYELNNSWSFGARFRLISGNPNTPIIGGVYRSDLDRYTPVYGDVNSDRLPHFQQLDLRVDKTWIFDTWKFAAYLSLINASNNANVESLTYNFDYTQSGSVNGLPILPVFGMKGEW